MLFRYRGVTFGGRTGPLIVTELTAPTTELRSDYKERLGRDGMTLSKDFLGSASWQMVVATNGASLADALEAAGRLESAWKSASVRGSTAAAPLDYSTDEGATWSRVYGRPGRFTSLEPDVRAGLGVGILDLEFVQTDPSHYSASEHQVTVISAPASVGGIIAPLVAPITTVDSGEPRSGILQNDGDLASPARVRFYGPSTNPTVTTDKGYTIGYVGTLAYDAWVEINAWEQTAKLNNGASVAGRMDRRTRISQLTVPAGRSEWAYQATDISGTSRAVIYWRDSSSHLR